jgi:hypothetical protein
MKVLKYPLEKKHRQTVMLPADGEIVAVQAQHDCCTVWVQTRSPENITPRAFVCAFTGDELPEKLRYRGTCQFHDGSTVVHVYEELVV